MSQPETESAVKRQKLEGDEAKEATKLDGRAIAKQVRQEVKEMVTELKQEHNTTPLLGVVVVGDRPDSAMYVRMKAKAAAEVGIAVRHVDLPDTVEQATLEAKVRELADDPAVHGILVQLPLPSHMNEQAVLSLIPVNKDVDGLLPANFGNLCLRGGDAPLAIACTPAGIVELLQRSKIDVQGKECVVLGRSSLVGMPTAALLQSMNATVTVCHSATVNIKEHVQRADILVAAIGKPRFVRGDWLKEGCVVIDVGISEIDDATRKRGKRLVGDVYYEEAKKVASLITPVPGGVGPMTVAMLLRNMVGLARHSIGLPRLKLRTARTNVPNGDAC